ncbi:MAG: NAD-dependent epimerase/dehydratase family protein [Candidatus Latescibacterota bacterium]
MKILVTAAESALGTMLCQHLAREHDVVPTGRSETADVDGYRCLDLTDPEAVATNLEGVDVVVHAVPCTGEQDREQSEQELLDWVSRSTYVLTTAACSRGVKRIVLLSTLDSMRSYDERFIVTTDWQPRPRASAPALAPHMAELVGREIARTGKIEVIALRLGDLGVEVSEQEVVEAVVNALDSELGAQYHWAVQHVASSGRFVR